MPHRAPESRHCALHQSAFPEFTPCPCLQRHRRGVLGASLLQDMELGS